MKTLTLTGDQTLKDITQAKVSRKMKLSAVLWLGAALLCCSLTVQAQGECLLRLLWTWVGAFNPPLWGITLSCTPMPHQCGGAGVRRMYRALIGIERWDDTM